MSGTGIYRVVDAINEIGAAAMTADAKIKQLAADAASASTAVVRAGASARANTSTSGKTGGAGDNVPQSLGGASMGDAIAAAVAKDDRIPKFLSGTGMKDAIAAAVAKDDRIKKFLADTKTAIAAAIGNVGMGGTAGGLPGSKTTSGRTSEGGGTPVVIPLGAGQLIVDLKSLGGR